jgi:glycosyltransferase involved in cell wall biosynthesis
MRLHLLGIPHTVTAPEWSHCAFTQKVRRFAPMMRPFGWQVIHYGVSGSVSGATEDVVLMDQDEHTDLLGHPYQHHQLYGSDALDGSSLYRQWNLYAREALQERVEPGDLILLPFGHAHAAAIRGLPVLSAGAGAIESGIGYYETLLPWRIWESYAARHASMGREGRHGVSMESTRLEFTVPNYYNVDEWPAELGDRSSAPVVYMGRLTEGKGIATVLEVAARRPDVRFQLIGQGDVSTWAVPANVEVLGSMGPERAALLGQARAIIAPSRYIEPFCGSVVEAQLCGTPAITSDFGAFAETVQHGITGFLCQTVNQFTAAVDRVLGLERDKIAKRARKLYAMERVGRLYDDAFEVVRQRLADDGFPKGW